jgi:hypothetical protein
MIQTSVYRAVFSPSSRLPWTHALALLAISILACEARADLAPRRLRPPVPSVELTLDGLAPNYVSFTRESLRSGGPFEDGRPVPLGRAVRLPSLYLVEKKAFEAWRAAHPPAPATQSRHVDEFIASAAVVACYLRSADDQVPRAPVDDPEWSTGRPVRLHYALTEASATRCVLREVGKPDAPAAQPPAAEKARVALRGGGCALFSGGSEHGILVLALLGLCCVGARRRSVAGRRGDS